MIKFFRKIRYDLMEKNKTGKYLKYAVGEIILVVLGILIALQINNWNENQKLNTKKQAYYSQLLDDLSKDLQFSKTTINKFNEFRKEYDDYCETYLKTELTPVQVYNNLFKLSVFSTPLTFNSSTIESLQNSGDIEIISPIIRNKLIDLRRYQDLTIKRSEYTDKGKNEVVQNVSLLLGSYPLQERLLHQPKLNEYLGIKENLRELILALEATHRWKDISEKETISRLEEMLKEISIIIELINKEIKN
jgi:hypothetical protein